MGRTKYFSLLILLALSLCILGNNTACAQSNNPYTGKAYHCNGSWSPFPCPTPTYGQKPTPAPTVESEDSQIKKELKKEQEEKGVVTHKESLIRNLDEIAEYMKTRYGVTSTSIPTVEAYCMRAEVTADQCSDHIKQIVTTFTQYEKEYNKRHGIKKVNPSSKVKKLMLPTQKPDFKF